MVIVTGVIVFDSYFSLVGLWLGWVAVVVVLVVAMLLTIVVVIVLTVLVALVGVVDVIVVMIALVVAPLNSPPLIYVSAVTPLIIFIVRIGDDIWTKNPVED